MSLKDQIKNKSRISNDILDNVDKDFGESVINVDINSLEVITDQPFKEYINTSRFEALKESIQNSGITNPLIVREVEEKKIILSGRHRYLAGKELGLKVLPCIIKKNINDDTANLILLDSNLCQREELLPSEKALSYKQKLSILSRQGRKSETGVKGSRSNEELAKELGITVVALKQYIRLTFLIPELLERVDKGEIKATICGNKISFLTEEHQRILNKVLEDNQDKHFKISIKVGSLLKELSRNNSLTEEKILEMLENGCVIKPKQTRMNNDRIIEYFNNNKLDLPDNDDELQEIIIKALNEYYKK